MKHTSCLISGELHIYYKLKHTYLKIILAHDQKWIVGNLSICSCFPVSGNKYTAVWVGLPYHQGDLYACTWLVCKRWCLTWCWGEGLTPECIGVCAGLAHAGGSPSLRIQHQPDIEVRTSAHVQAGIQYMQEEVSLLSTRWRGPGRMKGEQSKTHIPYSPSLVSPNPGGRFHGNTKNAHIFMAINIMKRKLLSNSVTACFIQLFTHITYEQNS